MSKVCVKKELRDKLSTSFDLTKSNEDFVMQSFVYGASDVTVETDAEMSTVEV